ncbi:MAG: hypothetical protein U9O54_02225 [Chloroflexota bacterium]|nr:hypothetical protein [Chloroflexota bacterium]
MSDGIDELHYQIPPDVLHYEPRFFFGLSATDLLIAAMPSILLIATVGLLPGVLAGVLSLSLLKRFESFGNRSMPVYFFQRWQYNVGQRDVVLPLIIPPETQTLQFESWDGDEVYRIEAEQ